MAALETQQQYPIQERDETKAVSEPPLIARCLPSLTDFAFLLPLFLLFGILPGSKTLLGDADLGWHLRTGEWIVNHHTVPTHDLYSYTKPNAPWFAWEWGWDLLFGAIHQTTGLSGIVATHALLLSIVSVLVFRLTRRACDNDLIAFGLTVVALCGSTIHWFARPHLLSWLFFLAFAHILMRAREGRTGLLAWLLPVTLLWANLHGSFFMGLALIGIEAIAPWLDWIFNGGTRSEACNGASRSQAWKSSQPFALCTLGCAALTFVNPYTWRLHQHIWQYIHDSRQMDLMQEFQSISFHLPSAIFFELMLALGGCALLWTLQKRDWSAFLTLALWIHLSLFAVRNVPLFLFLAAPIVARMLSAGLRSDRNRVVRWAVSFTADVAGRFRTLERLERFYAASAFGFLLVLANIATAQPGFVARFDPKNFPASVLPIIDRYGSRRIFSTDQWSAYLIYQRAPHIQVFIDDRSDFYGAAMLEKSLHIENARWDWEPDLLQTSTDMVIVAPDAPLGTVLKASPHWQLVLDDKSVLAFKRTAVENNHGVCMEQGSTVGSNGGRSWGPKLLDRS